MTKLYKVLFICLFVTIYFVTVFLSKGQAQVTLTVDDGSGAVGSSDNPIDVMLNNPSEKVKAVELDVCDVDDYLTIAGCETTERSSGFSCIATEIEDGCVGVTLFDFGDDLIEEGNGPIFTLNFDVSNSAPEGECRELNPENERVANDNNIELDVSSAPGEFCFLTDIVTTTTTIAAALTQWSIEEVDAPKYFDTSFQRAIAIDANNNPHIAYGGDHLYYAYFNGSIWHYETIDSSSGVGSYSSLALDANGKVHISCLDASNALRYATNASGVWEIETVDSHGGLNPTSIAIDSNNKVHICYGIDNGYSKNCMYATNMNGFWEIETIAIASENILFGDLSNSLALDSNNKAHISYCGYIDESLRYATNAYGSWMVGKVDSAGIFGTDSSIALDSNDEVHISYRDINHDLRYAWCASECSNTANWQKTTLDGEESVGWDTSIVIDSDDMVHISYYDDSNRTLNYATNVLGSWMVGVIDSEFSPSIGTSIAVDSNNKLHIIYQDTIHQDLKYTNNIPGIWEIQVIDRSKDVGSYNSLALDSNNKAHISYLGVRFGSGGLKYSTNVSGLWLPSSVEGEANQFGETSSIAVDSNNKVHISYYDRTNRDLKYATNISDIWQISAVDSDGSKGCASSSISLDSNGKVHISYFDCGNSYLKYATNELGTWQIEMVDSNGNFGDATSLAIDSSDKVHISYYDWRDGDLKYATNTLGSWMVGTVDSEGDVGSYNSIAVDSNDKVHISYYDWTYYNLKYVTNALGSWMVEIIDNPVLWSNSSLALDSNNKAHISYCGYIDESLKYATNAYGSWMVGTVDSAGNVGSYNSIAIDSNGKVHISYRDNTNKDLKYARNDYACEGNFDCDDDCDGSDAFDFKVDFGRSLIANPCESGNPCDGDFDCDNDCDGSDAFTFKEDFGRSSFLNPCPTCTQGDWCIYP